MTTYNSKAQRETQFMADSLNLSPSQISQVDSVNKSYLKNIALLEGQSISAAARKQRIIDYKTERDSGLEIILTEQQHHRYKDLLKSQENRMKVRSQTLQNQ